MLESPKGWTKQRAALEEPNAGLHIAAVADPYSVRLPNHGQPLDVL